MDRFIGPIAPTGHIPPPVRGSQKQKNGTPFPYPQKDGEPKDSPDPETDSSDSHLDDLPIGPARFDESGQRIDYTA